MNNARRGFLRNIGAVLAGTAAVGTVASVAEASDPVVSEPVKTPEPQIVYRDIPTFDEVLAKVKENKDLNDIEVLVFVGEFTMVAHKVDLPEIRKLREQGLTGNCLDVYSSAHLNKTAIDYWCAIRDNVKNLVKVHNQIESTILRISLS